MNPTNGQELREWLHQMHLRIMGDYNGDPWTEHPYQDENKPYFWEDEAKNLEALITAHTNAEIARVLNKIESVVLGESEITDEEEHYTVYAAIQAERTKLKEVK